MSFPRNSWYVAAWAHELADKPLGRRLLGEPVVLLRNSSGTAIALSGCCPHRFAPLHMGKVIDDAIQCPYHGLRFDATGACVFNPHGKGTIPKAARVRPFPLLERHGALWIWMGDPQSADPSSIIDITELMQGQRFDTAHGYLHVRANYQLVTDNLLDLSHAPFLHPLFGGTDGENVVEMKQVGNTVYSFNTLRNIAVSPFYRMQWRDPCPEKGDMRAHMRWDPPAILQLDTGMTTVDGACEKGPSAPSMHLLTPETDYTTHYFWSVSQNSRPEDASLTETIRQGIAQAFAQEDEPMIAAVQDMMGTLDLMSLNPVLLPGDSAAIRARRLLQKMIREEASISSAPK